MPDQSHLIYRYDGSFDGLLCCVFESYDKKEIPDDILRPDSPQTTLLPVKEITTDCERANRVLASIPKKIGVNALDFVRHAFLTCLAQKELYILLFLRMGYRYGPAVMGMLADKVNCPAGAREGTLGCEVVNTLNKAVKHLHNESQLLKGFLRFSVFNPAPQGTLSCPDRAIHLVPQGTLSCPDGAIHLAPQGTCPGEAAQRVLIAEMQPKNFVLPLLARHFCERYPEEQFLIHDRTHAMALVYCSHQAAVIPIAALDLPELDEQEQSFRELWQLFYDTIEIQGRHNPACRMSHMPKRYWAYMTEFARGKKGPGQAEH